MRTIFRRPFDLLRGVSSVGDPAQHGRWPASPPVVGDVEHGDQMPSPVGSGARPLRASLPAS